MYAARPTRQMTDRHMGTAQWMYGQMDKWTGKDKVFVRDAETNGRFYPKAVGEQSDGSAWDMQDPSDRLRAVWVLEGGMDGCWRLEEEEEQRPSLVDV